MEDYAIHLRAIAQFVGCLLALLTLFTAATILGCLVQFPQKLAARFGATFRAVWVAAHNPYHWWHFPGRGSACALAGFAISFALATWGEPELAIPLFLCGAMFQLNRLLRLGD